VARILVAYDTLEGQTRKIAEYISARVAQLGHKSHLANIKELSEDPISEQFDGAIIGASIHVGKHSKRFVAFVEDRPMWLDGMPIAFYSVSLSASGNADGQQEAQGYVTALLSQTGWSPQTVATVGGGLKYRRYGFFKRLIMRSIARRTGRDTDTSRDYEYTDWDVVNRFTDSFLEQFLSSDPKLQ
jgi:menaquinone-dependent protoporphyrinogen oxidase